MGSRTVNNDIHSKGSTPSRQVEVSLGSRAPRVRDVIWTLPPCIKNSSEEEIKEDVREREKWLSLLY